MTEKERARELFLEGYNCSQSVFCAFCHRFGLDEETAKKISAGLGGGVAHYMIFGLVGVNFLVELGINIVLSPVIVRLLHIIKK